jgi:hypothetical protein
MAKELVGPILLSQHCGRLESTSSAQLPTVFNRTLSETISVLVK